jgi:hypothetical protein
MEKYYEEKMSHMQKREFKYNTLFKQKNCMQSSSLNNITSIQKYNSRISVRDVVDVFPVIDVDINTHVV